MATGPWNEAGGGRRAEARLLIGSEGAQRSPWAHAQWLQGEVAVKRYRGGPGARASQSPQVARSPAAKRAAVGKAKWRRLGPLCSAGPSSPRGRSHPAAIVARGLSGRSSCAAAGPSTWRGMSLSPQLSRE
ncbi:zinc finger protein 287 isoform X4 [Erinaceus europaeus]|uniref:Zinc finger protein 287 isoform X4 n=1 Tax=Erinaceus europaeus TaxID=9365 RepID=A0ABM3YHC2_ERIEU|nr:zinc finger protein 287 isoform X4 [Erinaceus europaeus]